MAITRRGLGVATLAVLSALVASASVSWACSKQAQASLQGGQTSGPAGSKVTVDGRDFGPGMTEIHWNSKLGTKLGQATGSNFSVTVTIPEAPPGIYYIIASEAVGSGTSTMAFEVTNASSSGTAQQTTKTNGRTSNMASGADDDSSTAGSRQAVATTSDSTPARSETSGSSGTQETGSSALQENNATTPAEQASASGPAVTSVASGARATSTSPEVAPARPASTNPSAVDTPSGQRLFGASVATPAAGDDADSAASAATVSGDTWSGFATAAKPSLLETGSFGSSPSGGSASVPALGVGLLGSGVVALFAGFGLAEARRKRVLARGSVEG